MKNTGLNEALKALSKDDLKKIAESKPMQLFTIPFFIIEKGAVEIEAESYEQAKEMLDDSIEEGKAIWNHSENFACDDWKYELMKKNTPIYIEFEDLTKLSIIKLKKMKKYLEQTLDLCWGKQDQFLLDKIDKELNNR